MELYQLRSFLAVIETGTLSAAAQRCAVSQPTLSVQMAKLEEALGGPLFDRHRQGATLTARGRLAEGRIREILGSVEALRRDLEAFDGLQRGEAVLGCPPTTGAFVLPPLLADFRRAHPGVQVYLREDSSPALARALLDGDLDLGLVDEAGLVPGLRSVALFTEPLLVVLPPDHRLAGRGSIALEALADEDLILMKRGHGFRAIVDEVFRTRRLHPRVVYESSGIETVQALVEAGLGVSLVPRMVRKATGPAYVDLLPPTPTRTLFLAAREGAAASPTAGALEGAIRGWFERGGR